jgi:hypothetical protein
MLRLLARLKSDEDKRELVAFLNGHIEFLDVFATNDRSSKNRLLVAQVIMNDRLELLDTLGLGFGARVDQVSAGLEQNRMLLTDQD